MFRNGKIKISFHIKSLEWSEAFSAVKRVKITYVCPSSSAPEIKKLYQILQDLIHAADGGCAGEGWFVSLCEIFAEVNEKETGKIIFS